jgi:DNA (cytosine-5)-methyltransferase 1
VARPIAVDLFAGAGGMTLGFEQAGFDVVAAVEVDPIHAAVHSFNFPNSSVMCRDVTQVTGDEIRLAAGIGTGKVDVVIGGAPCQGFSLIGHRALDDPRNQLVRHFVRIVCELDASHFVFENVKGLTVGRHRAILEELVTELKGCGYNVRLPWRVLNAAHFGAPQDRQRLFLLGSKKGLGLATYPDEAYRPAGSPRTLAGLPEGPSCADALDDLPDAEKYAALRESDEIELRKDAWARPSAYARELRCLSNDAWHFGHPREWNPVLFSSSLRSEHTAISRRRFASTDSGEVEPISRLFKLPAEGVSNTLRAGTDAARGAFTSPRPIHHRYDRLVTVREMARLHGFPDWFRFHMTKWHGARQIGNSVPPPLARAIATAVIEALGVTPVRPSKAIALGADELLRMNMQEASTAWGIVSPISKRDRKSGAHKRKQHEIERSQSRVVLA